MLREQVVNQDIKRHMEAFGYKNLIELATAEGRDLVQLTEWASKDIPMTFTAKMTASIER